MPFQDLEPPFFPELNSANVALYRRGYRNFREGEARGAIGEPQAPLQKPLPKPEQPELHAPPLVGFGTFNEFKDARGVADAAVIALVNGYRLLDCARLYGNEAEIGEALREFRVDSGTSSRADIFVMSKLWCWDMAPEDVGSACRRSLQDLGLSYLDCYMMHWPVQMTKDSHLVSTEHGGKFDVQLVHSGDMDKLLETYAAMERLVDKGLVRTLGVSNFGIRRLRELLRRCRIRPRVLEVEMHPYCAQPRLLEYCQNEGIRVVAYSPLGKVGYKKPDEPNLLEDPVVAAIAEETSRSPGQVLLRWGVQRGCTVIPKSLRPSRIQENRDVLDWTLTVSQMRRLDELDRGYHFVTFPWFDVEEDSEYCNKSGRPVCQPALTPGWVDIHGAYHNTFERSGKPLKTGVLLKRGILKNLPTLGPEVLPACCHGAKNHLITDSVVDDIMGEEVCQGFRDAGISVSKIVIPAIAMDNAGEPSTEPFKSAEWFHYCVDNVLKAGISKNSCIVSLGGGVVNNICGVVAGTLYRGIHLVHITTTSMGMLDAAIDFKQAFNHECGKNLLGCYYPADVIVMDPCVLQTLGARHTLNGIAEALKHGLTQSEELVHTIVDPLLEGGTPKLFDEYYFENVCKHTIETKVPTLTHYHDSDYNEMVPQYGHAIAHAIEHLSWHDGRSALLHGEAVAIGMCATAEVSWLLGLCDQETVDKHYEYVGATGLPLYVPPDMTVDEIMRTMSYDKHYVKQPTMGLCRSIGVMATRQNGSYAWSIALETVKDALERNVCKRQAACVSAAA